mgnify:CR=1 FL=1
MRSQAREAGFFNKVSSGWARPLGWARPVYISRHPQPPAKYLIGGFMPKNKDEKFYRVRVVKESVYEIVVPLAAKRDYKDATSVAMDYVCKYGETVLKQIHGPTISPKPFDGPALVK